MRRCVSSSASLTAPFTVVPAAAMTSQECIGQVFHLSEYVNDDIYILLVKVVLLVVLRLMMIIPYSPHHCNLARYVKYWQTAS